MKRLSIFLIAAAVASACEMVYVPPCEMFEGSQAVFVGTAIATRIPGGITRFRVEEVLKGIPPGMKEIDVRPAACPLEFVEVGAKGLVTVGKSGYSNLTSIEDAEYIDFARRWARGEQVTTINGWTAANVRESLIRFEMGLHETQGLSGVQVTASKGGKTYQTTSVDGRFHLPVPQSGTYRVTATLPGYESMDREYEASVRPRSCAELEIAMMTASRVRGRVTGSDGRLLPNLRVQMELREEGGHFPAPVLTDTEGRFEFAKIPPGEYDLGINLGGDPDRFPYATRYYPGVSSSEMSRAIHIGGPQIIEGIDFAVEEPKLTRTITATVRWPDGQPVTNARVLCANSNPPAKPVNLDFLHRYTDGNGKVVCEILADRSYEVEADTLHWIRSTNSELPVTKTAKVAVPAGTAPVEVKIILDKANDVRSQSKPESWEFFNRLEDRLY